MFLLLACTHPPTATFYLGGDLHLGAAPRADPLFALHPLIGDLPGIVNLEGTLSDAPKPGDLRLINTPSALPYLQAAGIRVVSVANNHAADGEPASPAALPTAGIQAAGPELAFLKTEQLTIGVGAWDLTDGVPPGLADQLQAVKRKINVFIASFHVTGPPSMIPRPELKTATELALSAGASVVMAHGTHVLGPVERRGHQLIAWGLGNLAFACDCTEEKDSMLLKVTLEGTVVTDVVVLPIVAGLHGESAMPSPNPDGIFDLLEAIGTPALRREAGQGWVPR